MSTLGAVQPYAALFTQGLFTGTLLLLGREFASSQPVYEKQISPRSSPAGDLDSLQVKQPRRATMQAMGQMEQEKDPQLAAVQGQRCVKAEVALAPRARGSDISPAPI